MNIVYECLICNYSSIDKSNLNHHNKSKKHIFNIKKINSEKEKELIKIKDEEIEKLKQKLIDSENQKKEFEIKAQIYKEISEKAKNVNNNKIVINNNLSYANEHFKNAPPLKRITNFILNGIDLNDDTQIDKLIENIIYYYNNKCIYKLIGDHIIQNYKKENLKLQSFFAIDIARRKYIVKIEDNMAYLYSDSSDEIDNYDPEKKNDISSNTDSSNESETDSEEIKNNRKNKKKEPDKKPIKVNKKKESIKVKKINSKWINDNEGIKISYLLYEPLTKKIIKQLKKKCRDYNNEMKKNASKIPTMDEIKKFEVLAYIMKEIDTDKLKTNINNYIAPHFGLDKKIKK